MKMYLLGKPKYLLLDTKIIHQALAGRVSWLECHPLKQKIAGSIPSRGKCGRQQIDVSLSFILILSLSHLPPLPL